MYPCRGVVGMLRLTNRTYPRSVLLGSVMAGDYLADAAFVRAFQMYAAFNPQSCTRVLSG